MGQRQENFILRFILQNHIDQLGPEDFAFADGNHVGELGDWFRIQKRRRAAHNDQRIVYGAILCPYGHTAHLHHARHIQVVGFKRNRKGDHIEIANRRLGLERKERRAGAFIFAHLVQRGSSPTVREGVIMARAVARMTRVRSPTVRKGTLAYARVSARIRQENSLTRNIRNAIEEFVHRLKAKVGHTDRVDVGIAERDAQVCATLHDPADFTGQFPLVAFDNSFHKSSNFPLSHWERG